MSKKISIDQIATWRAGELMTERKLQEVFTLIGEVINLHAFDLDQTADTISKINVATRWLAIVDKYSDIQVWIENNKNNEDFKPPVPYRGDIFMVNNNSDDPNLPAGLNPGRYLYIYNYNPVDNVGSWNLYNPFALVNATTQNDGLMSKEAFTKLNDLPNNQKLTQDLNTINSSIQSINSNLDTLNPQVELNKNDITNLKTRANTLEQSKQNKRTDTSGSLLKGYKTNTVEDNLVEVKELVDNTLNQEIMIWEKPEDFSSGLKQIPNSTMTIKVPMDNITLESDTFVRLYLETLFSAPNVALPWRSVSLTGKVVQQQDSTGVEPFKSLVMFETTILNFKTKEYSVFCDLSISYGKDNLDNYFLQITMSNIPTEIVGTAISFTPLKIIKDIGVSDYMWSENVKDDIKEFLKNNLGVRKQLVTSNTRPDNFNGFRANDEFILNYSYVINSNSIELYQGGIKLTQGVEFEELQTTDPLYSNKIKFLKDVDISKDGAIEIIGQAIVVNTIQLRIWNNKDNYVVGNVVLHKADVWYCNVNNTGQEPISGSPFWTKMKQEIDVEKLKRDIKDYINKVSNNIIDDVLKSKQNGASLIWAKDTTLIYSQYQEYITSIGSLVALKAYVLTDDNSKSYVQLSGNDEQGQPIGSSTNTTIGQNNYAFIKINKNVYVDNLANINVLTATPEEVRQEVKAEFGNYVNRLVTDFKEKVLTFNNEADYQSFRDRNLLTDNDFEDVSPNDLGAQTDLTLKKENDTTTSNYSTLSINSKNDLVLTNPNGKVGITMNDKETPDYLLTETKANLDYGTKITQLQSTTQTHSNNIANLQTTTAKQTDVSNLQQQINTIHKIKVKTFYLSQTDVTWMNTTKVANGYVWGCFINKWFDTTNIISIKYRNHQNFGANNAWFYLFNFSWWIWKGDGQDRIILSGWNAGSTADDYGKFLSGGAGYIDIYYYE